MSDVDLTGLKELMDRVDNLPFVLMEGLKAAAVQEANNVIAIAIPLTPFGGKDGGTLRESKFVTIPEVEDTNVSVAFGFGGPSTPYALYQHEGRREDGSHVIRNHTEPGTQTHYLLEGINRARPGFNERVALSVRSFLDRFAK